ncbi:MAG: alpha/beta hydrolase fold domain-containing protein [Clostridia bacterium]|nr:alpha/beta hydrolase fold domain-containing protein [Clostridia bacterium]
MRNIKRIFTLVLCLVMVTAVMPKLSFDASAASGGSQSYSGTANTDFNVASTTINLSSAASVSGDTITYVADRAYHSTLADLGDVYRVNFSANGIKINTSISVSNYAISDYSVRNDVFISNNAKENKSASEDTTGHFVGNLPEVGSQISFTMTSRITDTVYYSGYYLDYSAAKTVTIVVKCVDSTQIKEMLLKTSGYVESCWSAETWATFAAARTTANSVINNANATQDQIDSACDAISTAKAGLVHDGPITECEYCINGSAGADTTGVISLKDVSYGPDARNVMDIYLPKNMSGDCSLIMYIHGGAWVGGDKDNYGSIPYADCAKYGLVTVSISYRYASASVNGNMIMDDVQAAVAKSKEIAAQYGLNLTKMMTTGASAGAHLAMLYAYARRDVSAVEPVCVFDQCGPTNLASSSYWNSSLGTNTISYVLSYMSGTIVINRDTQIANAAALLNVSPINYLATAVPTIICHGKDDATVNYNEATNLASSLWAQGTPCELITFPNSGHSLSSDPNYTLYANTRFEYLVNTYLKDSVPVQSHDYVAELVPMTCTSDGYVMYTCMDCGRYYISDIVKATHEPGAWEVITPATYEEAGLEGRICTICGNVVESRVIDKLVVKETPSIVPKEDSNIVVDEENLLITNVEQGTEDIEALLVHDGATLEIVESPNGFGTGSKVIVKDETTGEVINTYTVVISGDINGDGFVDAFDIAIACEYVNTFTVPDEVAYLKAVDIYEDDYIDATDLAFLVYVSNFEQ